MGVEEIRRRQTMSAQDQAAEAAREESMKQGSDKSLFAQNDSNQLNDLCETFESDFVADQGIDLIGRVRTLELRMKNQARHMMRTFERLLAGM
jgi:hypothetical protein